MMSAQTTDVKVNEATADLFALYPDAEAMAGASVDDVGAIMNIIGLWRNKAKNAIALSQRLMEHFDGELPRTIPELTTLPGVGRKTATAVLGTAFGIPAGVTVDTHMLRINALLKLSLQTNPDKMAAELELIIPAQEWPSYTHRIIDHGRLVCVALRPRCGVCPLIDVCPSARRPATGYREANDARVPASAKGLSWLSRGRS